MNIKGSQNPHKLISLQYFHKFLNVDFSQGVYSVKNSLSIPGLVSWCRNDNNRFAICWESWLLELVLSL